MSTAKESLIAWATSSPVDLRVKIFQVLDTVAYHHTSSNATIPLGCLQLPEGISGNISTLEQYIAEVGIAQLPASLQTLAYLRPIGAPNLPLLPPKVPSQTLGQSLAQMPRTHDHSHNYQYIRSWEHAQALLAGFATVNNKQGKTAGIPDCVDFPSDSAGQLALVGELFTAAVDYDSMRDKQSKSKKKDAGDQMVDSAEVARFKAANNVTIELICWKLLFAIKNAQDGNIGISGWKDPDTIKYDKYPTFRARFDTVNEALKKSKTSIDHMMATEFILRLAAAPKQEYRSVKTNLQCNANKQASLKAAQEAVTSGYYQKANDGNILDQNGNVVAARRVISDSEEDDQDGEDARPKKRQRTKKTASKTATTSTAAYSLPRAVQSRGGQMQTPRPRTELSRRTPNLQYPGPQAPGYRQPLFQEQSQEQHPFQPLPIQYPSFQPRFQQPGPTGSYTSMAQDRPFVNHGYGERNSSPPSYQSRMSIPQGGGLDARSTSPQLLPQRYPADQNMPPEHDSQIINHGQQNYGSMPRAPLSARRTGTTFRLSDMLTNPVTNGPTPGNDLAAPSAGSDMFDY